MPCEGCEILKKHLAQMVEASEALKAGLFGKGFENDEITKLNRAIIAANSLLRFSNYTLPEDLAWK